MSLWKKLTARWGTASQVDDVRLDPMTVGLETISTRHGEVHDGHSFVIDVADTSLAIGATLVLAFKTPVGIKRSHIFPEFSTLIGGDLSIWEGPSWTTNTGTQQAIINRLRVPVLTPSVLLEDSQIGGFAASDNMVANPTGLNTGSAIRLRQVWAWGKKEKFAGGAQSEDDEFILEPDTTYAIVFTSVDNSNGAQIALNWYEHTDIH